MTFKEYFMDEPERFSDYAFKENPDIKNFEDFSNAMFKAFDTEAGKNTGMTTDDLISLFETSYVKSKIGNNVSDEEFDNLYGNGNKVERIAISEKKVITISIPKISSKGYTRKGKPITRYSRTKPRKFTPVETKFLQVRKAKKIPSKQIIRNYEQHFSKNPRTSSSLKSKIYRL
jgi:hypothetical protein